MKKILLAVCVAAALSGCAAANQSKIDKDELATQDWSADRLYSEARDELDNGNYPRAITLYGLLRSRPSEGRYAEQALLEEAYAHHKNEEPEKALANIIRFEKHYPGSMHMDYALYLHGLVLFGEDMSFLKKLSSQDWSDRDPDANRRTYYVFDKLVKTYPNSKYAGDARKRLSQLVDALGGHEISIARYYAKRGAYVAAANRAQKILEGFQNTRYVEEALGIMLLSYNKMDKPQLAADTRRVLEKNYPDSPYLKKDWEADDMSWWKPWR